MPKFGKHFKQEHHVTNSKLSPLGKKPLKTIGFYLLAIVIYYLWFQSFYNMVEGKTIFPYKSLGDAIESIVRNFITISAVFAANTAVIFLIPRRCRIGYKVLYDLPLSIIAAVMISLIARVIMLGVGAHPDFVWSGIILNDLIIYLINEGAYFFYIYYRNMQKAEEAEKAAIQLKYDVLKAQVDPHFLFNSLNILYSLSAVNAEETRDFILSLSQMYRYILTQRDKPTVKLSEELVFVKSYLEVLEKRHRGCLFFNISGLDNAGNHEIIPYSTQLLIENVTKHNIISQDSPMHVAIEILPDHLTISNNIRLKKSETSSRIGLHYLSELYNFHGKNFTYTNDGITFTAYVPYLN